MKYILEKTDNSYLSFLFHHIHGHHSSSRGKLPRQLEKIRPTITFPTAKIQSLHPQTFTAAHRPAASRAYSHEAFVEDYSRRRIQLSALQRGLLAAGSAGISLGNPFRGDMIACLGETTGEQALVHCRARMLETAEGRRIIEEKPRINTATLDLGYLERLPEGSVGRTYSDFLRVNVRARSR